MFSAQASGNLVIYSECLGDECRKDSKAENHTDYSVLLYKGLGQSGGMPLILGAIYCTIAAFLNYICAVVIDRWGRVRLFGKFLPS